MTQAYCTTLFHEGEEYSVSVFDTDKKGKITSCDITYGACNDLGFEGDDEKIRQKIYSHLEENWDKIFSEENKKYQIVT